MTNLCSSPLYRTAQREISRLCSRPLYLFCMVIAPLFCCLFFTSLMGEGLPTGLPAGIVDLDNTSTSRSIVRNLDAFQQTEIVTNYPNFATARQAMQRGDIYAFYFIPKGTTEKALASRQPRISFYTNFSYLVAGSLLYKDQRTMSELASGAIGKATLLAKGATEEQAMTFLQPITIDTHPLNNPWLNYSVYLSNIIVPGILMLLIFLVTVFSIGSEQKAGTHAEWLAVADDSIWVALAGKLLPQTALFFVVTVAYNSYLYGFLHYPCNGGLLPMLFLGFLLVIASQGVGLLFAGLFPSLRLAMSAASLWGVVSFSMSGMSFPVMAMSSELQALANLFPLRHYFLYYVNSALNGYPITYVWSSIGWLLIFTLLPLLVVKRLEYSLKQFSYLP
ncbi:MAG: ABC transporter permease [Phocaeicola sp.]